MTEIKLKEAPLSTLLEFIVDNRGKTAPTSPKGIPLIATDCVSNANLYPIKKNLRFVDDETYKTWFRSHPKPGDILLTNKGSQNGQICIVPDPVDFCIAQDMVAIRADKAKVDPLYLFAALRSDVVQQRIKMLNVDSVIPHFKKTDFDKLAIPLPEKDVQRAIGQFYFNLCKKTHINRQLNETLEATARAIFKSWFVDFDPVKAKAAGKKPIGMDDATAALFPDSFEDSELGPIPKGWRVDDFGSFCEVISGTTPSTAVANYWFPEEHNWTTPKDLSNSKNIFLLHTERRISSAGLAQIGSGLLPTGSVLLSSRAPIGYVAINAIPVAINQGYAGIKTKFRGHAYFIENWLRLFHDTICSHANGSTFQEISKGNLKKIRITQPNVQLLAGFQNAVDALYEEILSNQKEISKIIEIRENLLPKLLSGELKLEGA